AQHGQKATAKNITDQRMRLRSSSRCSMSDILCSSSSVGGGTGRGEDVVIGRGFRRSIAEYGEGPGRGYAECSSGGRATGTMSGSATGAGTDARRLCASVRGGGPTGSSIPD